ncbi:DEAD/DEAH box helicase, partial [Candidatus Altiarchaeota archaeon]
MDEFKALGLSDISIEVIKKKGYEKPSPIQVKTIPLLMKGDHNVVGRAQTGTGKTACFALPILENLKKSKDIQALILTPTRELAVQVATEIKSLTGDRNVRVATIYGGASIKNQMDDLRRGVEIVVGTPGRIIDLIGRRRLDISRIAYAVLDEADEMLNMGFLEDIEEILGKTNQDKKMLLFSATMPAGIIRIAERFMREYELVTVEEESLATDLIDQVYYDIRGKDRYAAIRRIIVDMPDFYGIIFCKTKLEVDALAHKLVGDKYSSAALHGDISQAQRENILKQFKKKRIKILIATDVAARGIDVNDLTVVINHSLPQTPELYVHRIGRTGRMGNKGTAITFIMPSERR